MYETGDGNELFGYNRILGQRYAIVGCHYTGSFGIFYGCCLTCKTKPVTVCQIYIEIFVFICRLFQINGDGGRLVFFLTFRHVFRTCDVTVVLNTAVFVHLHNEVVVHRLHLVFIADIAGKYSGIEV